MAADAGNAGAGGQGGIATIDGYVADCPYPSNLHTAFQPPWTDWNLARRGIAPPRTAGEPFTTVDLGCGDGFGLILAAAAHPQGRFIGVDAMPEHVTRGRELAAAAGIGNVTLHCADFGAALALADGEAHYVTAQGVIAWVSEANRAALYALAARWLRPGGALTLGYNCQPGWGRIAAFQKLVRTLAASQPGTSAERFAAAVDAARASGLIEPGVWEWFDPQRAALPDGYFAHEYLNAHWAPCWSAEVIGAMAAHGVNFAGQVAAMALRQDVILKAEHRAVLATMPEPTARELALDLVTEAWFRQDLFVKAPHRTIPDAALAERLLEPWWVLSAPPEPREYRGQVAAGTLDFDTPAARAIVARLGEGPGPLAAVAGHAAPDLVNAVDALYALHAAIPVDPPGDGEAARRLNAVLAARGHPVAGIATPHGAVAMDAATLASAGPADWARLGMQQGSP